MDFIENGVAWGGRFLSLVLAWVHTEDWRAHISLKHVHQSIAELIVTFGSGCFICLVRTANEQTTNERTTNERTSKEQTTNE